MKYPILAAILLLTVLAGCSPEKKPVPKPIHEEVNSVYYWKTVLDLDSASCAFIRRHDIRRVYLRMFDVTEDICAPAGTDQTVPNATVRIDDRNCKSLFDLMLGNELIPTVFITVEALKASKGNEKRLADNIVTRVRNMCEYNNQHNVRELQLDCDWTETTEKSFFALCDSVKQTIAELNLPWRLSSTIRLYQLARPVPPVDNGVLMVYNTGSFDNPDATNSIIDVNDVKPYLKRLSSYPLHLDVAYPTYSWQLLFRKRKFAGLLSGLNLSDPTAFDCAGENRFIARHDIPYGDRMIRAGDMVRQEVSDPAAVIRVKTLIEKQLAGRPHSNIIYHLDPVNLSKYTPDEIDRILSIAR